MNTTAAATDALATPLTTSAVEAVAWQIRHRFRENEQSELWYDWGGWYHTDARKPVDGTCLQYEHRALVPAARLTEETAARERAEAALAHWVGLAEDNEIRANAAEARLAALSGDGRLDDERDALRQAFIAGATAVHSEVVRNHPDAVPRGDPEFGEAADDYARSALAKEPKP